MKLIGRIEPVMHLQGRLNAIPGGTFAPGDEAEIEYIVRDENGVVVPSELVEEESNARTKILQLLESLGGSLTDEEIAEIEAEVDALLNETDPAELGNLSGFSIVNKIRLAQTYRDDVVSAMEAKGVVQEENQPFRTVADLVEQFNLQEKTVVPSAVQQIINPDDGYFGLKPVIVEAANLVENLPRAEAFAFGADLTLPVIPADVLASHPKAVIFQVTSATSAQFVYIAAKTAFYRVTGALIGMEYDEVVGSLGEGVKASASGSGAWGDQIPAAVGTAGLMVGTEGNNTYSLVWANHDIYEVLAVDTTTGNITTGAVYFAASSDTAEGTAEEYRIQKETLDGFGEEVNRLCNTVEPMTPERMTEKLQNLDITLQDIVITPSDEEQIIKPEGHYGFYKITVEAVEDSGGTGGGTGGEGGEGGESYGSAENVTFGNEYEETEKVFMDYSTGGYNVPEMPAMPAGAYQALCENSSNDNIYYAVLSPIQMAVTGNGYYIFPAEMDTELTVYEIDLAGSKAWTLILQRTVETVYDGFYKFDYNCVWTNADIMVFASDSIYKKASPPATQRTETTIVVTPVEREETYTIGGDTLNSLVGIAQQVTGSKEPLTPEEATEILDQYSKDNWEGGSY